MSESARQSMNTDTIAAISTPYGMSGIGIIRISGREAFRIAGSIFRGKKPFDDMKSHTVSHGKIINPDTGATLDDVLIIKMKGPNTFTAEDIVEISCHGGVNVLRNVLALVIKQGARPAEPGEFTKRAFLNGRIDLAQAEAVIDLINSKTDESSKAAVAQLEGKLSDKIRQARKKLIGLIANIEAAADFPEHDIEELTGRNVYEGVREIKAELQKIAASYEKGRLLHDGITVAIIGKPNAGKSSLLNALAGCNRAIVTDIPGTTRDIIEEYVNVDGIPVRFMDTAGIRKTDDPIESIGVERAQKAALEAELVIAVFDAETGLRQEDAAVLEQIRKKKKIIVINKIDTIDDKTLTSMENKLKETSDDPVILASMLDGTGVDELLKAIGELFMEGRIEANSEVLVTNLRHRRLLDLSIESLSSAERAYETGLPMDLTTIDINEAAECLGQITGESVSEDVIREIFSRFCIGK